MRALLYLAMMVALTGCYGTAQGTAVAPAAAPATAAPASASAAPVAQADTQARLDRWEREWQEARREVVVAREEAVSSGQPIEPEVDAEVTELLNRNLQSSDPEERIQRLEDAVEDALRLAELVSIG